MSRAPGIEDLLRAAAPQVLAAVLRRFGDFADSEEAVQEALIAASAQWPSQGTPESPVGWLIHVASRRMSDRLRSDRARREREVLAAEGQTRAPLAGSDYDDTLALMLLCAHPSLSPASAIALTLRAVGGLTTAEIARAFLVPEATMAQRIGRAKQSVRVSPLPLGMPGDERESAERLRALLQVLYLIFNEGYLASSGGALVRGELSGEAIRLTRIVRLARPRSAEVAGLLALMLLTEARRAARTDEAGELIPLAEQNRELWREDLIREGDELLEDALSRGSVGEYQLQAAIAAEHDRARRAQDTDWREIAGLYALLARITNNPMVALNRAVAVGKAEGAKAGLALLAPLEGRIAGHHRLHGVRAHLLEMDGEWEAARVEYGAAAAGTRSLPEQHYLLRQAARLGPRARPPEAERAGGTQ